jgi:hypothetical protein
MTAIPNLVSRASAVDVALAYGRAKSCQDIAAALACCTDDFVLEAIPFGTRAAGRTEVEYDLTVFFQQFPDYRFTTTSHAESADAVVLWGHVTMTWSGRLPPNTFLNKIIRLPRRRIELPAVSVFDIRDGLLARERFHFDMRELCRQLRLPQRVVRGLVRGIEERRYAAVAGERTIRIEHSRIIAAPIEEVYARGFADVGALMHANPRWPLPRARKIELVDAPVMREGAIRRVHLSTGHVTDERIEHASSRRIRYRIVTGWGRPWDSIIAGTYGEHELEPQLDGSTRVVWRGFIVPRGALSRPLARLVATTILAPMFRRYLRALDGIVRG